MRSIFLRRLWVLFWRNPTCNVRSELRRQDSLETFAVWFKYQPIAKVFVPPPFQLSLKLDWFRLMPEVMTCFHLFAVESALDSANTGSQVVKNSKKKSKLYFIWQRYKKPEWMAYFPMDKRIWPEKTSCGANSMSPSPVLKASVFAVIGSIATEL